MVVFLDSKDARRISMGAWPQEAIARPRVSKKAIERLRLTTAYSNYGSPPKGVLCALDGLICAEIDRIGLSQRRLSIDGLQRAKNDGRPGDSGDSRRSPRSPDSDRLNLISLGADRVEEL